jgi:oligopeptide transport system substrate-binding protein
MEKPWFSQLDQIDKTLSADHGSRLLKTSSQQVCFEDEDDFLSWAEAHLPTVECAESPTDGCTSLTIFTYARPSQKVEIFLMELVSALQISDGLQLRSLEFNPYTLKNHADKSFLIAKFHFLTERKSDFDKIQQNRLPLLKKLTLFLSFSQYSATFMQFDVSTSRDELNFHEAIMQLLNRWPDDFEKDFIRDYQHFLGLSQKEFRNHRSMRHQLRLLSSLYLMRKKVMNKLPLSPNELHLEMRLIPALLRFPFSQKAVLGIAIVINLPSPYERFEDHHIIRAVQKLIPWSQAIKESFLSFQRPGTSLRSMFLEIEKTNDSSFTLMEIALLKANLRNELLKSVEVLSPSIFGLCDVEEVMRNTFLLSQELQSATDLPQVMISFEGSSSKSLIFRVIVVRLLDEQSKPLPSYFQELDEPFEYIPERSSTIGYIGKFEKESTIFRFQISKTPFLLRSDSSLNLHRARQYVYSQLSKALGEIRDYNGGLFAKQLELFLQFKQSFQQEDNELLEDFFHSIQPPELQAILPLSTLKTFFQLFLSSKKMELSDKDSYFFETKVEDSFFFAVIRLKDSSFQERMMQALIQENLYEEITAWTVFKNHDDLTLGYIYRSKSGKHYSFDQILRQNLEKWSAEKRSCQTLRLEVQDLPVSLDPRLGGDDMSIFFLKMLFEGLMRIDQEGKPNFAIAANVTIGQQGTKYVFSLRKCLWNNGDPVTAQDFSYAWKKILSPNFKTAFAYLFYDIKNARKVKEGKISMEDVGIYAFDDKTLIVELERPCSYFLELAAHPLFSPINHRIDRCYPNWSIQTGLAYICNGPFCIESKSSSEGYIIKRNLQYWDSSSVMLDRILLSRATARKALELFEKGEIDWLGRPSRPWEPFFSDLIKKPTEKLSHSLGCWCACNVQQTALQSPKIRLALAYAIDRDQLINRSSSDRISAYTPLPLVHTQHLQTFTGKERELAPILFQEGLEELGIGIDKWPSLTLIHANNEVRFEIASNLVKQWKEVLGITVHLEAHAFKDLFAKMTTGNYQLGMMMWRAWVDDPLYTLNAFKHSTEEINFSKWENHEYQQLLDRCNQEINPKQRKALQSAAESILIKEMPVIPITYEAESFHRREYVEGKFLSKMGNLDFKYVSINKNTKKGS